MFRKLIYLEQMKRDTLRNVTREFAAVLFTLPNIYILITAIFFGIVYVYVAEPARMTNLTSSNVAAIIFIYALSHTFFALVGLPYAAIAISGSERRLFLASALVCLLANGVAVVLRFVLVPFHARGGTETVHLVVSISITALILTLPGWLYFAYRNRHRLISILQNAGVAIHESADPSFFRDDLQKLLPVSKRGHLLHLKASGNYTQVMTTAGTHLLRIGIGEAERATSAKGLRVHKSYWVARDEIMRLVYVSGNPQIVTQSGETIPVSRSAVPALRSILAVRVID